MERQWFSAKSYIVAEWNSKHVQVQNASDFIEALHNVTKKDDSGGATNQLPDVTVRFIPKKAKVEVTQVPCEYVKRYGDLSGRASYQKSWCIPESLTSNVLLNLGAK